jgi:restriction system protein
MLEHSGMKGRDEVERRKAEEEKVRVEEEERKRTDAVRRIVEAERERREEQERLRIESLLRRDVVQDEINYMSGAEFEKFMTDLFRPRGYAVEETPASGDQGVDLILPDYDGKRVAVQLKRWSGPVGNAVVGATFGGMAHYRAEEGRIITTSTFTPKARELARSTRVRLINGKELAEWLEGLREQE